MQQGRKGGLQKLLTVLMAPQGLLSKGQHSPAGGPPAVRRQGAAAPTVSVKGNRSEIQVLKDPPRKDPSVVPSCCVCITCAGSSHLPGHLFPFQCYPLGSQV